MTKKFVIFQKKTKILVIFIEMTKILVTFKTKKLVIFEKD